jgi:proliferating cell nuclear antigen PCNA
MKIVIKNKEKFDIFANIFRYLPVFMEMVNINVSEDGIYLQGMDTSQVCLFELKLLKEWFTEYEIEKSYVLGIHCNTFYKVIHCLEDFNQIMKLEYNDGDCLKVSLESERINKYFDIPLIDIDSEMLEIPNCEYDVDIEIHSLNITNYVNQLMIFDEDFNIKCTQDNIFMSSKSESGSLSIEMNDSNIILYCIEEDKTLQQSFSLNYVKNMCAFSKITNSVVINLKDETPMRFHQSLDDVEVFENSENYIRIYLAPKMED